MCWPIDSIGKLFWPVGPQNSVSAPGGLPSPRGFGPPPGVRFVCLPVWALRAEAGPLPDPGFYVTWGMWPWERLLLAVSPAQASGSGISVLLPLVQPPSSRLLCLPRSKQPATLSTDDRAQRIPSEGMVLRGLRSPSTASCRLTLHSPLCGTEAQGDSEIHSTLK